MRAAVWILPLSRLVLVTEDLSPLCEPSSRLVDVFEDLPVIGWGKAGEVAEQKAKELGYTVDYQPIISDIADEDGSLEIDA